MSRTQGRYLSDLANSDGQLLLALNQVALASETTSWHRIAAGKYALRAASASSAYTIIGQPSGSILRTGMQDDLLEPFGSARAGGAAGNPIGNPTTLSTSSTTAGSSVSIPVLSSVGFSAGMHITVDTVASTVQEYAIVQSIPDATHIQVFSLANAHTTPFPVAAHVFTTPAGVTGRPPFTGTSEFTPVTSPRPKGLNITGLIVNYAVNTTAITVPTIGLYATNFVDAVAPTVTTLITLGTNGLATAAASQPYSIPVVVPTANQGFIVTPDTIISAELNFTTASSGSVDVLGIVALVNFNYQ